MLPNKTSSLLVAPNTQVADAFKAIVGGNVSITNTVVANNRTSDANVVVGAVAPSAITLYINASKASVDSALNLLKIRENVKDIDSLTVYNLDLSCPK
jgi:hypothetical protein